jgi:dynein heavy chain
VKEIARIWEETSFVVKNYRDTKDRFFITEIGSKFVNEIRSFVAWWEKRLSYISDLLDEWLIFQKTWMYLENIFNAEDI